MGVGIDLLEIDRLERALERHPRLADRVFTQAEQDYAADRARPGKHLAARFAAKEAVAKALGAPVGLRWLDAGVRRDDSGRPTMEVSGTIAARAAELGVDVFHLSLSHDAGIASAVVIAERSA